MIALAGLVGLLTFGMVDMNHEKPEIYYIYHVGNEFNTEEQILQDLSYKAEITCQDYGFTTYVEFTDPEYIEYMDSVRGDEIESEYARAMYVTCVK